MSFSRHVVLVGVLLSDVEGACLRGDTEKLRFCADRVNYTFYMPDEHTLYMNPGMLDLVAQNLFDIHENELRLQVMSEKHHPLTLEEVADEQKDEKYRKLEYAEKAAKQDMADLRASWLQIEEHFRSNALEEDYNLDDEVLLQVGISTSWDAARGNKDIKKRVEDGVNKKNADKDDAKKKSDKRAPPKPKKKDNADSSADAADKAADVASAAAGGDPSKAEAEKAKDLAEKTQTLRIDTEEAAKELNDPDEVSVPAMAMTIRAAKEAGEIVQQIADAVQKVSDAAQEIALMDIPQNRRGRYCLAARHACEAGHRIAKFCKQFVSNEIQRSPGIKKMQAAEQAAHNTCRQATRVAEAAEELINIGMKHAAHEAVCGCKSIAEGAKGLALAAKQLAAAGSKQLARSFDSVPMSENYEKCYRAGVRARRQCKKVSVERAADVVQEAQEALRAAQEAEEQMKCNPNVAQVAYQAANAARDAKRAAEEAKKILELKGGESKGDESDVAKRAIKKAKKVKEDASKKLMEKVDKAKKEGKEPPKWVKYKLEHMDMGKEPKINPNKFREEAIAEREVNAKACLNRFKDWLCAWMFRRCDADGGPFPVCKMTAVRYATECQVVLLSKMLFPESFYSDEFYSDAPTCTTGIPHDINRSRTISMKYIDTDS